MSCQGELVAHLEGSINNYIRVVNRNDEGFSIYNFIIVPQSQKCNTKQCKSIIINSVYFCEIQTYYSCNLKTNRRNLICLTTARTTIITSTITAQILTVRIARTVRIAKTARTSRTTRITRTTKTIRTTISNCGSFHCFG